VVHGRDQPGTVVVVTSVPARHGANTAARARHSDDPAGGAFVAR
jgi:formyltetrahydrofolate hydrolase